ncbi:MAG: hypothetical protein DRR08_26535 [Candidatus Parabeggiatoa sp. nov. 2]|nr:MAG: hypothetical protein DRR08_26535 [Gammaproteobacteria bacterium]
MTLYQLRGGSNAPKTKIQVGQSLQTTAQYEAKAINRLLQTNRLSLFFVYFQYDQAINRLLQTDKRK